MTTVVRVFENHPARQAALESEVRRLKALPDAEFTVVYSQSQVREGDRWTFYVCNDANLARRFQGIGIDEIHYDGCSPSEELTQLLFMVRG